MRYMIFVLYFVAGLAALEGLSALLRRRADPARVRNRLRELAMRVAEADARSGSILRRGERLHLPNMGGLQRLLYRGGASLNVRQQLRATGKLILDGDMLANQGSLFE